MRLIIYIYSAPFSLYAPAPASDLPSSVLLLFAGICHAGIAAFPFPNPLLEDASLFGALIPGAGATAPSSCVSVVPLTPSPPRFGVFVPLAALPLSCSPTPKPPLYPEYDCPLTTGVCAPPVPPPTLFCNNILRLLTSFPNSSTLLSSCPFHPSSAFGTISLNPRTWSAIILASFSLRVFAALRSLMTSLTDERVVSSFSVRAVSDSLMAAVSEVNWSMRVKARAKEASTEALSASNCGGVGGEMRGRM